MKTEYECSQLTLFLTTNTPRLEETRVCRRAKAGHQRHHPHHRIHKIQASETRWHIRAGPGILELPRFEALKPCHHGYHDVHVDIVGHFSAVDDCRRLPVHSSGSPYPGQSQRVLLPQNRQEVCIRLIARLMLVPFTQYSFSYRLGARCVRIDEIVKKKSKQRAQEASMNAKVGKRGDTPRQKPTLPNISLIEEGRNSPIPGATPRIMAPPYIPGSPAIRKTLPVQDPYRRQFPPRAYSPAPRSYTPSLDDGDTKLLQQNNFQQHYHNQHLRQDQHYDFSDDRSEISDGSYTGFLTAPFTPKPQAHGHQRQGSDTGVLSSQSHSLHQGYVVPKEGNSFCETVMLMDLGLKGHAHGRHLGHSQGHVVTGLGGGLGHGSSGSVMGGSVVGSSISYGSSYSDRGGHHHPQHHHHPRGPGHDRS